MGSCRGVWASLVLIGCHGANGYDDGQPTLPCDVTLSGTMLMQPPIGMATIAYGANVCENGAPCAPVDSGGHWRHCASANSDIALGVSHIPITSGFGSAAVSIGFGAQVWPYHSSGSDETINFMLLSDPLNAPMYLNSGITYPPNAPPGMPGFGNLQGYVFVTGAPDAVVGATIAISPAVGVGPVYAVPDAGTAFHFDPTQVAVTSAAAFEFGGLPPGNYDISVATAGTCRLNTARFLGAGSSGTWASPVAGAAARVPVYASYETVAIIECN
jgi:hypothetical protein